MKFVSVFAVLALLALLLSASAGVAMSQRLAPAQGDLYTAVASPDADLQPGVSEFITDTYLAHSAEYPDENEPVPLLRAYLEGQELLRQGKTDEALALFRDTVVEFPECRHAHAGLGAALWQQYENSQRLDDLRAAIRQFIDAADIGIRYGKVRYTGYLWQGLAQLGDTATMDDFFQRAIQVSDNQYLVLMDYARGLAALADPRAEEWFAKAVAAQPAGNVDALAYYAEWLLEQGRDGDVLQTVSPDEHVEYLHFLRGVALERVGRTQAAKREYAHYAAFSLTSPAPNKFRIPGSVAQEGIVFEGDSVVTSRSCNGYSLLANVIECESAGESEGGQRAVGWTVRTRVFKGTLPACVYVDNSGSTLSCKYDSVITQPYQFVYSCGRSPGATPQHVRYDVWYGHAPDPVAQYCPSGSYSGSACSGSVHCTGSSTNGASNHGPMRFYSTTSDTCTTGGQYSCLTSNGQTCQNGGSDHCFYSRP
jgi:tetratricopeptide (TPR) repeat protein